MQEEQRINVDAIRLRKAKQDRQQSQDLDLLAEALLQMQGELAAALARCETLEKENAALKTANAKGKK